MNAHWAIALLAALAAALPSAAATVLFDFETDETVAEWQIRSADQDRLERSDQFAASGEHSALFLTPKWQSGLPEWPAFEAAPPVADWTPYDRLSIVLANPAGHTEALKLYVTDSKTTLQKGGFSQFTVPPKSYHRAIVPLPTFPEHLDLSDVTNFHFYTTRPENDFRMYIDAIVLLKKGEEPPAWSPGFVKHVLALTAPDDVLDEARSNIDRLERRIRRLAKGRTSVRNWAFGQVAGLTVAIEKLEAEVHSLDITPERLSGLSDELERMVVAGDRLESLVAIRKKSDGQRGYAVGFASSMEKVLPRDVPLALKLGDTVSLSAARNETESFQVVVVPFDNNLEQVRVEVGDLVTRKGQRLPSDCVDTRVVGYVKTARPPYLVSYVGWWPDPLLDFLPATDIEPGDAQAFWVRVCVPKDQAPGKYHGEFQVTAANAPPAKFRLDIEVHDFLMPDRSPLPTAISIYDSFTKKFAGDWDTFKFTLADFLADYYIDFDSLYRRGPPDFEVLERLHTQGRLATFNLGYFSSGEFEPGASDEAFADAMEKLMARLRPAYEGAKERGMLDKAYIYGFDECNQEYFPILQRIALELKKAFPEVPVATTTRDYSFGLDSAITAIDAWTPLTPQFRPEKVAAARQRGVSVWWYICCGPAHPYANWFVEYPAIETRLLMGAMAAKYRPEAFLYYAITRWANNEKPIVDGPFTSWNPASYKDFNGDGSLLCPGPDGRPLATVRLENFRDGLEDYAYVRILEETIAAKKAGQLSARDKRWLDKAEALLEIPEELVARLTKFTHDPAVLYKYRAKVAKAIESAGIAPANPWKD